MQCTLRSLVCNTYPSSSSTSRTLTLTEPGPLLSELEILYANMNDAGSLNVLAGGRFVYRKPKKSAFTGDFEGPFSFSTSSSVFDKHFLRSNMPREEIEK